MKKAFVIAGGVPQIELIKQLKKRGYFTILADGSNNPMAKPFADKFYHVNIFDINSLIDIAQKEKINFFITVCADQVLLAVAEASERLGLPCYIDWATGKNVSDKIRMKKIFIDNNIPTTKYVESDSFDTLLLSNLNYPLVVKPVDAYSSKGVRKAENFTQLVQYYKEATEISRSGRVIVEEFFEGKEISIDAFVVNGVAKLLCVTTSEKVKDKDRFVIFRGRFPADIDNTIYPRIENIIQKIADAFNLVNSPLLVQMLINGNNISVLEFCARTGGNMKYLLIKYSTGVDVIGATIDITEGKIPDLSQKIQPRKVVVNDFIYCKPGIFTDVKGIDTLLSQDIINEFHLVRQPGTEMKGITSSSDRVCGFNTVANSKEEYNEKLEIINNTIAILDQDGRDIMRHDVFNKL